VEKVTAEDVDRVARKYLIKNNFAVLVVGKAADFDKPLSAFGPVSNIDITIPQPAVSSAHTAPSASNPEGKALLTKAIAAAGGADKLNAVKAMRIKMTITPKSLGLALTAEETMVIPDSLHQRMSTPGGELVIVIYPQDSFVVAGTMGVKPMPSSQREDQLNGIHRYLWYVAQHANDPQFSFAAQGTEKVGEIQAAVLEIHGGGQEWRWYIDPQTGHVLRGQSQGASQSGPATRTVDFSDWKAVDGISLPFHEELSVNGQVTATMAINSYEVNPAIDPKMFQRPPEKPQ